MDNIPIKGQISDVANSVIKLTEPQTIEVSGEETDPAEKSNITVSSPSDTLKVDGDFEETAHRTMNHTIKNP